MWATSCGRQNQPQTFKGHGHLGWHDPEIGQHIVRYEDLQARANAAEARVRKLEAELERRRQA